MIIDSEKDSDTLKIYLYLHIQEYYLKDNELKLGTGEITPAVVTNIVANIQKMLY